MAVTQLTQKEYLKKYLSDPDDKKKKKKKKLAKTGQERFRVVDDDIDLKNMRPLEEDEIDLYNLAEDAPQIAGIIDERPDELRTLEEFRGSKRWKIMSDENGDNDIKIISIGNARKQEEDKKMTKTSDSNPSSSKKYNGDSDTSPPRKSKAHSDSDISLPRKGSISGEDHSPPRKVRKRDESDSSPPRKNSRNMSPVRRPKDYKDSSPVRRKKNDIDLSYTKKNRHNMDQSPVRKGRFEQDKSGIIARKGKVDVSPPRRNKHNSDLSPPRKSRVENDSDTSPPRRIRKSDLSPPRKSRVQNGSDSSPPRRTRKSDSDQSPPRNSKKQERSSRRHDSDSDASPPRKTTKYYSSPSGKDDSRSIRRKSLSPSRRNRSKSPPGRGRYQKSPPHNGPGRSDSPTRPKVRVVKTLDGKRAGLQDARGLKEELSNFKRRDDELFAKLDDKTSGKGADVVMRDRRTGKRRNLEEEARQREEEEKKLTEHKEKYSRWGKGLKQVEEQKENLQQALHEMSKPLARYADDDDLERHLRDQEREGDPMLDYIRSKKTDESTKSKPKYKGSFLPNRFGIHPGHRWDGVDRSNGYEKQWFEHQNSRKAVEEEAYKWSTSDM